jgi:hypothetical protein
MVRSKDIKILIVETINLLRMVQPVLKRTTVEISQENLMSGDKTIPSCYKALAENFNELVREAFPNNPWLKQVQTRLNIWMDRLRIRRADKSEFSVLEKICKIFCIKINATKDLCYVGDFEEALNGEILLTGNAMHQMSRVAKGLKAESDSEDEEDRVFGAGADVPVKRNFNEDDEDDDAHPPVYTCSADNYRNVVAIYERGTLYPIDVNEMLRVIQSITFDAFEQSLCQFRDQLARDVQMQKHIETARTQQVYCFIEQLSSFNQELDHKSEGNSADSKSGTEGPKEQSQSKQKRVFFETHHSFAYGKHQSRRTGFINSLRGGCNFRKTAVKQRMQALKKV